VWPTGHALCASAPPCQTLHTPPPHPHVHPAPPTGTSPSDLPLRPSRRNPIISQVNRFKGCLCVAAFKLLLALRLNGVLPNLPIRVVCLPYYFAAILRCVLHFAKEPITPPDGSAHRTARPGTPVNPVHLMIVVLACRVDGLHPFGPMWASTLWPMWLLFGLLVLASLGAGCLAIGILVTREPRERGYARHAAPRACCPDLRQAHAHAQKAAARVGRMPFPATLPPTPTPAARHPRPPPATRARTYPPARPPSLPPSHSPAPPPWSSRQRALFFLCYGILITITVAGITFLLNLVRLLDGDRSVSYDAIIGPLIGGYSTLLGFYMAFTLVLPRLMLHDVTIAAISDLEEEEEGGVLDLVSQQLAPPFLVQQSSTLFRRMNTGTMWERYIVGAAPEQQQTPAETELAISDLEAPDAACVEAEAEGPTVASLDELAGGAATLAAAPPPAIELSEYEALQLEIEAWVRAQQRPPQAQPKPRRGKGSVQAAGLGVPSEIKAKLQRFVALKQLLAAAACAEACGACCTSTPSQLEPLSPPRQQIAPSPAAAPAPLPPPADADPPQSKTERGINVAIRAAACGAAACSATDMAVLPSLGDALAADEERADASDTLCWICFEGQRDAVLLECGHGGICFACAQRCFKKKGRICPMCRQPVTQVVHIELDAADAAEPERNRGGVVRIRQVDLPAELQ
jgi:hypothetical protein